MTSSSWLGVFVVKVHRVPAAGIVTTDRTLVSDVKTYHRDTKTQRASLVSMGDAHNQPAECSIFFWVFTAFQASPNGLPGVETDC
jgi:hypothetical protein